MSSKKFIFTALVATSVLSGAALLPVAANAADWIEKVEIKPTGIDLAQVQVSANASGYTAIKSTHHDFILHLYAKATNGERIVAMEVMMSHGARYWEGSPADTWSTRLENREVGAGTKRTVSRDFIAKNVPLSKVKWNGSDPRQRCELNLQHLKKQGMTTMQVLSQPRHVKAYAKISLDAVAAKRKKAENHNWDFKSTAWQRDGEVYEVDVLCNAGLGKP
ncbi:hypothetical protein [Cohaesibacter haloalkalitolerans]|uniref:hypothetical protein n=1 Tax=Cohaesibacter haloalkalitolerans TaxID=1162980 RepID=UPI000E65CC66|nr:hypothetical protein [Cohaesibacter haloalkalitolerans]